MKQLIPALTTLGVAALVVGLWLFSRGGEGKPFDEPPVPRPEPNEGVRPDRSPTPNMAGYDFAQNVPTWVQGLGAPVSAGRQAPGDLPPVINELLGLTWGFDAAGANNLAVKTKLLEFRAQLPTMSEAELQAIADLFSSTDQPGFKYHMLVAFRSWCADPFVDCIEAYYENEPRRVEEALQFMVPRTPKAALALERILEREFDPARRVQIIASAGFMGHPSSQPMLERAFERAGSVDRRQAVTALARIDSAEVRERLHALIEGDYEEAVYDISEDAPVLEEQRDLRAHAVSGLLGQGKPEDIARLIERSRKSPEDDAVAHYVEKFFPAVKRPGFVKDVVDIMIERGRLSTEFLLYISRVGTAADLPEVRRLEALGREGDDRTRVQSLIDAIW